MQVRTGEQPVVADIAGFAGIEDSVDTLDIAESAVEGILDTVD